MGNVSFVATRVNSKQTNLFENTVTVSRDKKLWWNNGCFIYAESIKQNNNFINKNYEVNSNLLLGKTNSYVRAEPAGTSFFFC